MGEKDDDVVPGVPVQGFPSSQYQVNLFPIDENFMGIGGLSGFLHKIKAI